MEWYFKVLRNYVGFRGRARRREYWYFQLFNFIASMALGIVDKSAGTYDERLHVGWLAVIYALAVLLPHLAVSVRRLHDTDHSGWWFFILLVPLVGWIVYLVFMVRGGTAGSNRFGPDPKALDAYAGGAASVA